MFIQGNANGFMFNFIFLRMQELGADTALMGAMVTVNTVSEIPFFFFSGKLIEKLGTHGVLIASFLAYSFRLSYYALLTDPYYVFVVELLHGLTFSATWSAATNYVGTISPPGMNTTVQGLLAATYQGLGGSSGAFIGGFIYSRFGGKVAFFIFSCVTIFGLALIAVGAFIARRRRYTALRNEEVEMSENVKNNSSEEQ
jgi:MFS family permease